MKKKSKVSLSSYIDSGGLLCPCCGEDGGIEWGHSLEHTDERVSINACCTNCGSLIVEEYVYNTSHCQNGEECSKYGFCPKCNVEVEMSELSDLWGEDAGVLRGGAVCQKCNSEISVYFSLNGWSPN